ncbi:MAG: hypothetical protein AB7P22_03215, partial [Vicinamibacterales bacterium]
DRLQALRGSYGIKAPAPSGSDQASGSEDVEDPATCQVVRAPAGDGARLVPSVAGIRAQAERDGDAEIRLTYRQLSALIEDAIRSLR